MVPLIAAMAASSAAQPAGSYFGAKASESAAAKAAQAQREALAFQKQQWATTQKNIAPWIQAGERGLSNYERLASEAAQPEFTYQIPDFQFDAYRDPGADYQMSQAAKALNNSSIAKGLMGGGAVKAILAKQHELAGTAYGGAWNRYLDKSKMDYTQASDKYKRNLEYQNLGLERQKGLYETGGQMAAGLGQMSNTAAQAIGSTYGNIGEAQASGILGKSNAINQGITGLTNTLSQGLGYYYGNQTPTGTAWDGIQTNRNLG